MSPDDIPQWAIKLTAVFAVLLVTLTCVWTTRLGPRVAVVFTSVKVAALVRGFLLFRYFGTVLN